MSGPPISMGTSNATAAYRSRFAGVGPTTAIFVRPPDPQLLAALWLDGVRHRDTDDHVAYEEACRTEGAAFDALTETPPTSVLGMRALLEFLDEWCGGN